MKKNQRAQNFSWNHLEKQQQELLRLAVKARSNAQAPYSHYAVGAAVLSQNGGMYSGCNVERCSYTQTTHAEQNAVDTMIAHEGSVKIEAIAVVGAPQSEQISLTSVSREYNVKKNQGSAAIACKSFGKTVFLIRMCQL
ncbi:MAG: hypothetical protein WD449_00965 [Candidatus Babeliales bacterium]